MLHGLNKCNNSKFHCLLQILRQQALECVRSSGHARHHQCLEVSVLDSIQANTFNISNYSYL